MEERDYEMEGVERKPLSLVIRTILDAIAIFERVREGTMLVVWKKDGANVKRVLASIGNNKDEFLRRWTEAVISADSFYGTSDLSSFCSPRVFNHYAGPKRQLNIGENPWRPTPEEWVEMRRRAAEERRRGE